MTSAASAIDEIDGTRRSPSAATWRAPVARPIVLRVDDLKKYYDVQIER